MAFPGGWAVWPFLIFPWGQISCKSISTAVGWVYWAKGCSYACREKKIIC